MSPSDASAAGPEEGTRSESDPDGRGREHSDATADLTRSDERVLAYLDDAGTDYPAFVASNTGLYVDHVESRLEALEAAELAERVTGEEVYRVTDAGRDALRDDCAPWSD
ncbi:DUF2250 domain-containing protein [Halorubrum yunnanense]|uniref:DUF2250 domain-containing protein n=1 Tax=Halorubrum yunnanense TaxID=1526162 RepID=A0ABD5YD51_9EURY|nr:DUF2250 domain-containing protein [Halorubrum yunnanense]